MLNQNYEPLTVCPARRAMVLLFQGKAEMIETADGLKLRTVRQVYSLPSVVRLSEFKRVPYKRIVLSRKNILTRDGNRCQYCGTRKGPMTLDHVIPSSLKGNDSWENLVTACVPCNNRKGDRTPEKAGLTLARTPSRPNHVNFIQRYIGVKDNTWRPYLFMD